MRRVRHMAVVVLLTFACAAPAADARPRVSVVPAVNLAGNSGGDLLGDWFVHGLSLPADESPFAGSADLCLSLGRHGHVLSPAGGVDRGGIIEMSCTVQLGRPVLLVMTSADCSSAEEPPFFGAIAADQRLCALEFLSGLDITSITVSVDGAPPVDIHDPRFLAVSPQRRVVFPANAVFGARRGPATFVAAAWIAELRGMKQGRHTVRAALNIVLEDGPATFRFIVHFDVVPGGRLR